MRGSRSRATPAARGNRCSRRRACASPRSADLPGRSVRISAEVPAGFDAPLAAHHKLIGRWAADYESSVARHSRPEARARIERVFNAAVLDVLAPVELANLRVVVFRGDADLPPAIGVICDDVGQLELGWIEKSNALREVLAGPVAPVSWQAAAYKALVDSLPGALPIFTYEHLFDEVAMYYWDGETEDEAARQALITYHGADPQDLGDQSMPSEMNARRPAWMLAENASPLKHLPPGLADRIRALRAARMSVERLGQEGNAWRFEFDRITDYIPEFEDCSHLPPLTLVPFDQFARELDDVAQHGMQQGFMDVAGLCLLTAAGTVEAWFASLRRGADLLLAAQALIDFDPTAPATTGA